MKKILLIIIALLFVADVYAQEVGEKAPAITVSEWIGKAPKAKDNLTDKVVVIDFWATWCRPCIASIPHMNSLAEKFQSDDVVFVSLSREDAAKVKKFTAKKEFKSYVAIDNQSKTNVAYRIMSIPQIYVIKNNKIVWKGHPMHLNEKVLESLIN